MLGLDNYNNKLRGAVLTMSLLMLTSPAFSQNSPPNVDGIMDISLETEGMKATEPSGINNSDDVVIKQILPQADFPPQPDQENVNSILPSPPSAEDLNFDPNLSNLNQASVNDVVPLNKSVPYSGDYYDAENLSYALGGDSLNKIPRQVDPRYEPGTSFVTVQKSAGANSRAARLVAAQRALDLGRYNSALNLYEGLYKKEPKNSHILMGLAVAQHKSGFTESAIATYEELLARQPKNISARANMLSLMKETNPALAYRELRKIWDSNRSNANVASELGLISAKLNKNDEAIKFLGAAASIEPKNSLHYYNMGVIYDRVGANEDAIKLYEMALDTESSNNSKSLKRKVIYDRLAHLRRL